MTDQQVAWMALLVACAAAVVLAASSMCLVAFLARLVGLW